MSDSEKSSIVEGIAGLDIEESKVSEDSSYGETAELVNSGGSKTAESITGDDARSTEELATAIVGVESNDKKRCSKKDSDTTNKVPSKSHFSASPHLTRVAKEEYLSRLLKERENLILLPNYLQFKHAVRLVNREIAKIRQSVSGGMAKEAERAVVPKTAVRREAIGARKTTAVANGKKVFLQEKIFIPVNEYPNYNFVGRILGPRGMTAKQLEEQCGCRIMIRGRGSTRESNSHRQTTWNDSRKEELHVLVQCEDFEEIAKEKIRRAAERIRYMLIPPPEGEDELKRKQLMELSIINGTYRPTIASRIMLRSRPLLSPINLGQVGTGSAIRGTSNIPVFTNRNNENNGCSRICNSRIGANLSHNCTQHYPYNTCTANTRQALASLGFDMDAFEVTDCYGRRVNGGTVSIPSNQQAATVATTTTTTTATGTVVGEAQEEIAPALPQYPRTCGFTAPVTQYVWNPPVFNVYDNSSNMVARECCNHIVTGSAPTVNSNGISIGDEMTQSSNVESINLQQYLTAAALLNATANFCADGSGDGPNGCQ
ncbi:unnamed protein product [Litomosoides sigmodontis]|uniref:K Homology domain-containing protein n=1 Tax=Litomosoides sigmodontis TaxID=42156 RepID=A0A3P6TAK8_LITSI|nr:unnamed protein product [Litomosoides sigmodontis]